ncbi:hypothetical protein F7725_019969, partial [Dissostichus mawsoni]
MVRGYSAGYTNLRNMDDQGQRKVSGKKFHVSLAGCTNGAHETYVNDLKGLGQIEVISPEQSDYLVLFCPIASRVGTDIGEAMDKISDVLFHESKMLICNRNDMAWFKVEGVLRLNQEEMPAFVEKLKDVGHTEVTRPEISDYLLVFCPIASRIKTDIDAALNNIPGSKPTILVVMHHTFNPHQVVISSRRAVNNAKVFLTVDCLFYEGNLLNCECNDIAWEEIKNALGVSRGRRHHMLIAIGLLILASFKIIELVKWHFETDKKLLHIYHNTGLLCRLYKSKKHGRPGTEKGRLVENPDVIVTVDVLFHESKMLICNRNDMAWSKVEGVLVRSPENTYRRKNMDDPGTEKGRLVENPDVIVTVDVLFHESKMLICNRNDMAWSKVEGVLVKFHVSVAGCTNGAHQTYVNDLKGLGQIEVISPEQSDYLVLFCPIASRVGTDIGEAMDKISDHFVPESRRLVENPDVIVTVDVLFHESKMLICNHNDMAWSKVEGVLVKFHVSVAGCTNGAHQTYVNDLKGLGQIEVISPEQSDYLVLFCPIASRVGTDIGEAMDKISAVTREHVPQKVKEQSNMPESGQTSYQSVQNMDDQGQRKAVTREHVPQKVKRQSNMPESGQTSYQSVQNMDDQGQRKVPGKKFHVSLAGCTNGAHETYVNDLKGLGQIEVISPEQSDYLVLFCPIASRVGTDIGEAMDKISDVLFHESEMLICNHNDMAWS